MIHFKKFCASVYTGISKVDELLKFPPDSISEGVIFQIFLGLASRPPSAVLHTMSVNMPASLYIMEALMKPALTAWEVIA